jgi:nucleotide-binding universal stress UspA family protein
MAGDPTRSLAKAARLADLVVTAARNGASTGDAYRTADPGSLVLQAGRPVLVAADAAASLAAKKVVIAWKEAREARRAVADAVPLLLSADEVIVVTVDQAPDEETRAGLADVAAFLLGHGIKARTEVITAKDESERLREFVTESRADLVISGAYGHSRLREWAFGGVTRSLLDEVGLNRFMAS